MRRKNVHVVGYCFYRIYLPNLTLLTCLLIQKHHYLFGYQLLCTVKGLQNDLLSTLSSNDLAEAFKCAFILNSPPTDAQSLLCAEWKDYYNTRIASLKCCSCKASFPNDQLFMSSCGHFSCTICSPFL